MSEPGTPLPWKADAVHGLMVQSATAKLTVIAKLSPKYDYHPGMQTCQKNAAYIVEACNTYPQLRAENERLRGLCRLMLDVAYIAKHNCSSPHNLHIVCTAIDEAEAVLNPPESEASK